MGLLFFNGSCIRYFILISLFHPGAGVGPGSELTIGVSRGVEGG